MTALETIILRTIQSPQYPQRKAVAGVLNNEEELWEVFSPYQQDRNPDGMPPLDDLELAIPAWFGVNLFSFFRTYLAQDNLSDGYDEYNCHRFALWMINSSSAVKDGLLYDAPEIQQTIREGRVISNGLLELGQLGVFGCLDQLEVKAYHSLIGLGEQSEPSNQCIQVSEWSGRLSLSSLADVPDYYHVDKSPAGKIFVQADAD
ncbi:MAG TPA: hypothetical protein VMQ52_00610 [Candidatus Saccharimonadales bacterium]|jgi:hypothetical protein|nr:hypothetical protein [Candidatus Saccharimonadales bacterium]